MSSRSSTSVRKILSSASSLLEVNVKAIKNKIDALCEVMREYGIIEIARTGAIALSRGPVPVKEM